MPAAPIILLLVLLVRLTSRGPGIYRQRRTGLDGRTFSIYKIRTMAVDAEAATGAVWSTRGDPRVTLVGRLLRWSHLDELPQLVNVMRGQMCMVGPRPERPEIVRRLALEIPHYGDRLAVPPGITGLAQVLLPADSDVASVRRKLALDLAYVRHGSTLLDGWILAATVLKVFAARPDVIAKVCRLGSIKPVALAASRGVIRADDRRAFVAAFRRIAAILEQPDVAPLGAAARQILVEDFIPGIAVALEGLLDRGRLRVLALFDKPEPLDGPFFEETIYVTPSRLPEGARRDIAEATENAIAAIGLREGPVHAELRLNDAGPWVIEVAARSIGGLCARALRFGAGIALEELILRHALGLPIETLKRERHAAGVMMLPIPRAGVLREVRGAELVRSPLLAAWGYLRRRELGGFRLSEDTRSVFLGYAAPAEGR